MGKTLQVIADRRHVAADIVAAREVLELRFPPGSTAMSLRAAKLLHLLIRYAGGEAADEKIHRIPIGELSAFHISRQEFMDCCAELFRVTVELETLGDNGQRVVMESPLLTYVEREKEWQGDLLYELSRVLRLSLRSSNHWAILSRQAVMAFQSRYSLRLYEIISVRVGLEHVHNETFSLDDLRALFGVPAGKLLRWQDLRRNVIEPAIGEVDQLSGLAVRYEPLKRGRGIIGIRLIWREKDKAERAATARELDRSSVGREVRRKGAAELIAQESADRADVAAGLRELGNLLANNMRAKY